MSNRWRTLFIAVVLLILWGTIAAAPFRVFAEAVRDIAASAASAAGLSGFARAAAVHLAATALMVALILAGRTGSGELVAGACILAGTVYHMIGRLADQTFTYESTAVLIGLAVTLVFMLFRFRAATLWLGGAFAASIAVMLLYDAAILPAVTRLGLPTGWMPAWMHLGTVSLAGSAGSPAGLPGWLAGAILAIVSTGALFAFTRRRRGSRGSRGSRG